MHECNCVRMKHWWRQAQPIHVHHMTIHVQATSGQYMSYVNIDQSQKILDLFGNVQHRTTTGLPNTMKQCLAGENPDAVMFASRINPKVLSDPLPLSGCVVAALEEELEPAVSPLAVVAGVRHGGCPTASVATARATSNRSAAASNQSADFADKAPEEALAGPPLSLDGSPDIFGQCTIFEPAVCVFD